MNISKLASKENVYFYLDIYVVLYVIQIDTISMKMLS